MTAKELFLEGVRSITHCTRDINNAAIGCSKCPLLKKTACSMELIAWDMVKGGELYG